jgi:hypothetical protein
MPWNSWLVNTPETATKNASFYDPNMPFANRSTWEHVDVMACAVKMLDVRGIGAGKP